LLFTISTELFHEKLFDLQQEVGASDLVANLNLINVAVSRAVNQLIVVVSEGLEEKQGTNICDLVRNIKYNNPFLLHQGIPLGKRLRLFFAELNGIHAGKC
jgi:hypothetical protein